MEIKKGKRYRYTFEAVARQDGDSKSRSIGSIFPIHSRENIAVEELRTPPQKGQFWSREDTTWLVMANDKCVTVRSPNPSNIGKTWDVYPDTFSLIGDYLSDAAGNRLES
jgi:hypothetical protein